MEWAGMPKCDFYSTTRTVAYELIDRKVSNISVVACVHLLSIKGITFERVSTMSFESSDPSVRVSFNAMNKKQKRDERDTQALAWGNHVANAIAATGVDPYKWANTTPTTLPEMIPFPPPDQRLVLPNRCCKSDFKSNISFLAFIRINAAY
jgi:hypothetical protein